MNQDKTNKDKNSNYIQNLLFLLNILNCSLLISNCFSIEVKWEEIWNTMLITLTEENSFLMKKVLNTILSFNLIF